MEESKWRLVVISVGSTLAGACLSTIYSIWKPSFVFLIVGFFIGILVVMVGTLKK